MRRRQEDAQRALPLTAEALRRSTLTSKSIEEKERREAREIVQRRARRIHGFLSAVFDEIHEAENFEWIDRETGEVMRPSLEALGVSLRVEHRQSCGSATHSARTDGFTCTCSPEIYARIREEK